MSADPINKQKKFCEKFNFPFPLLADESKKTIQAYKAWGKKQLYGREYEGIMRYTYVIDENGKIERAYENVSVKTHAHDILNDLS